MLSDSRELYKGKDITVRCREFLSDELFITFTNWVGRFPITYGFGERLFSDVCKSGIYFISHRNHWWQTPEIFESIRAIEASGLLASHRTRITYGSSMGAYAAVLFSQELLADIVIALSPQVSIDTAVVPFESRYHAHAKDLRFIHDDLRRVRNDRSQIFIFYDPYNMDAQHARLLSSFQVCEFVAVPFSGHPVTTLLHEAGCLKAVLFDIVAGRFSRQRLREALRPGRRLSPTYWLNVSRVAGRRKSHTALAIAAAERACALAGDAKYHEQHGRMLMQAGRLDEAEAILRKTVAQAPGLATAHAALSTVLSRLGRLNEAVAAARQASALQPQSTHLAAHLHLLETRAEASRAA